MQTMFEPLRKYATFTGRASRKEYWLFFLFCFLSTVALTTIDQLIGIYDPESGYGIFSGLFSLGILVPAIAVAVRRLHDTNRSGWWVLISLIPLVGPIGLIVLFCFKGTQGDNRFGAPVTPLTKTESTDDNNVDPIE